MLGSAEVACKTWLRVSTNSPTRFIMRFSSVTSTRSVLSAAVVWVRGRAGSLSASTAVFATGSGAGRGAEAGAGSGGWAAAGACGSGSGAAGAASRLRLVRRLPPAPGEEPPRNGHEPWHGPAALPRHGPAFLPPLAPAVAALPDGRSVPHRRLRPRRLAPRSS